MVMWPLSAPFRGLYLPNVYPKTLQTTKRHTFRVSAFHRCHWFGGKTSCRLCGQSKGTLKREKYCFGIWLRPRYKIPEFFTIASVLTTTLTVCAEIAAIRCLYIGLINQSINNFFIINCAQWLSETKKCKLRKNAQWRAASEAICISMLAAHNEN